MELKFFQKSHIFGIIWTQVYQWNYTVDEIWLSLAMALVLLSSLFLFVHLSNGYYGRKVLWQGIIQGRTIHIATHEQWCLFKTKKRNKKEPWGVESEAGKLQEREPLLWVATQERPQQTLEAATATNTQNNNQNDCLRKQGKDWHIYGWMMRLTRGRCGLLQTKD